ncbi:MAG: GerMN domain-containing protein [Candidatus Tectomicrobia bacterium]|uniref:GerMN domain-containing protein n=1 Tax=Tectimicrobiota bacterium TaxID=2528274 RepID=A0A933GMH7_UNCTE|nr:GerMN domain-containing protein [Candidatus Tectomicrobia bacterium]
MRTSEGLVRKYSTILNIFIWVILIIGASSAFYYVIYKNQAPPRSPELFPEPRSSEQNSSQESAIDRFQVIIFYPEPKEWEIKAEKVWINKFTDQKQLAQELIKELTITGEEKNKLKSLPKGTKLNYLFISQEGIAYLDFRGEISRNFSGGALEEYLTIYALVDTLVYNMKGIVKIQILIDGKEAATLAGHVDISEPLLAAFSLVREM